MSKAQLWIAAALLSLFALVVSSRSGEEPSEPPAGAATATSGPAAALERARRGELEMAVMTARQAAQCGYTDVGYVRRTPAEAATSLVNLMNGASAPAAGGAAVQTGSNVRYVLGRPQAPWQVAVRPSAEGTAMLIEGFGEDLSTPLVTRQVPCP